MKKLKIAMLILYILSGFYKTHCSDTNITSSADFINLMSSVRARIAGVFDNVPLVEAVLYNLFGIDYKALINLSLIEKQNIISNRLNISIAAPIATLDSITTGSGTDDSKDEEDNLEDNGTAINITQMEILRIAGRHNPKPTLGITYTDDGEIASTEIIYVPDPYINGSAQFKLIQPRQEQKQDKEVCATYSIVNAWVLQNLLDRGKEVNADTIFKNSKPIVDAIYTRARAIYGENLDGQIDPNKIFNKLDWFINDNNELNLFKKTLNVLGIAPSGQYINRIYAQKEDLLPTEIKSKFNGNLFYFNSDTQMPFVPKYKNLIKKYMKENNQRIINFICNTGGHWILISVVYPIGGTPTMYYIDSSGSPLLTDDGTAQERIRYAITIFKNFIDEPIEFE